MYMEETKKSVEFVSNWLKEGDSEHPWVPDSNKASEYILWFKKGVEKKSDRGMESILVYKRVI